MNPLNLQQLSMLSFMRMPFEGPAIVKPPALPEDTYSPTDQRRGSGTGDTTGDDLSTAAYGCRFDTGRR
jgi:hypothetical protein